MKTPNEQELIEATKRLLREEERAVDELTVARLRAARRRALDTARRPHRWQIFGGLATAGVVAALAGVVWLNTDVGIPNETTPVADIELLTSNDGLEFYNDIDFYDWLANQPDAS
jgi:hypothetical protein